ncbi:MAG: hypothetical protein SynsKO_24180 [Synoicihabitans sp.]
MEQRRVRVLGEDFTFKSRQPDGSFGPTPLRDYYYPITLAVPLEGNESIIGYDLRSAPTIEFLEEARRTGKLVATHQFTLAQRSGTDDLLAINLIMPVFARGNRSGPDAFRGFVQCIIQINASLSEIHGPSSDEALNIFYLDASAGPGERRVMYANLAGEELPLTVSTDIDPPTITNEPGAYFHEESILIGGREWKLVAQLNPAWAEEQRGMLPWLILGGGLTATILLSSLVNSLLLRNRKIERTVERRTEVLNRTQELLQEDIQRRKEAEQNLQESQALFEGLLHNCPGEIFVKDLQGRYTLFNREYESSLGLSADEIRGKTDDELFEPELANRFAAEDEEVFNSKGPLRYESEHTFRGRHRVDLVQKFPIVGADGKIRALGGIVTDVAYRAEAEKLRQDFERKIQSSQKMESLGVLAGGIAHDFNNILATVLSQASMLRRDDKLTSLQDTQLERIEIAARRAAGLCEQMLTYAGQGGHDTEPVDVNEIGEDIRSLLAASISKRINLTFEPAQDISLIEANPSQLRQVVMNLVINATDAIGEDAGCVTLRTAQRTIAAEELNQAVGHPDLAGGEFVVISVDDDGPGIKAEDKDRIAEPFFTTKFHGRGLGLSTVLGIVQKHDGAMAVKSSPGEGATFTIMWPVTTKSSTPAHPVPKNETTPPAAPGSVLVVDDEDTLREVAASFLELEGLTTFEAADGEEALRVYRDNRTKIDLVLLDLTMPGMPGAEVLRTLKEIDPEIRVIILSGYAPEDPRSRLAGLTFDAFIQKPYELNDLIGEVHRLLGP